MHQVCYIFGCLFFCHILSTIVGEPSYYRQYRILSGYPYSDDYYTYYTNPYYYHPYRYKYAKAVRNYDDNVDNNVYITDKYGRTTVTTAENYRGFY